MTNVNSNIISFADNMLFNSEKFQYISYHIGESNNNNNVYITPRQNDISKSTGLKDLGILMSENCSLDTHVASVTKKCSSLCGWILRIFSTRSK